LAQILRYRPVLGIKIAALHRYSTLDIVRAVAESGRDITLYRQ
jgi:hypothetical protein